MTDPARPLDIIRTLPASEVDLPDEAVAELGAYRACMAEDLGTLDGVVLEWMARSGPVALIVEFDWFDYVAEGTADWLPERPQRLVDSYLKASELIHPDWTCFATTAVNSMDLVRMNRRQYMVWVRDMAECVDDVPGGAIVAREP